MKILETLSFALSECEIKMANEKDERREHTTFTQKTSKNPRAFFVFIPTPSFAYSPPTVERQFETKTRTFKFNQRRSCIHAGRCWTTLLTQAHDRHDDSFYIPKSNDCSFCRVARSNRTPLFTCSAFEAFEILHADCLKMTNKICSMRL